LSIWFPRGKGSEVELFGGASVTATLHILKAHHNRWVFSFDAIPEVARFVQGSAIIHHECVKLIFRENPGKFYF
jgi:hypothetical protein